jgi:hypothetical protein
VNAVERRYVPYKLKLPSDKTASAEAAAAAAAHAVLMSFSPRKDKARRQPGIVAGK